MRQRHAAGPLGALLAIIVAGCSAAAVATPGPPDAARAAAAISEAGLRARLGDIATATAGSDRYRAVGSEGYERAADLVEGLLEEASWSVSSDSWTGVTFTDEGGSTIWVGGETVAGDEVRPLLFAPAGEAEGRVVAIGGDPAAGATGSGCAVADYGELPSGAIVVVLSGDCLRRDQVLAAQDAGAAAFIAVDPGAPPGVARRPTLIDPSGLRIPAAGVSPALAEALLAAADAGATARLVTHARTWSTPTRSILAELPGAEAGAIVMLGAHLDSVTDGPGINDNGSGVAALLEIARALSGTRPRATLRLAFWSGEELGLHGSYRDAAALDEDERRAIVAYLNADMIASPNGYAGVYREADAPEGSEVISGLLTAAVRRAGRTPVMVDLGGGSDHLGFARAGIPTGGVFSGADDPLTDDQAAASGAIAGRPADPCYHQPCDDLANTNVALARSLAAALVDTAVELANDPGQLPR